MRLSHLGVAWTLTVRELSRSRFALVLVLTIPTLFYSLVALTSAENTIAFRLASVSEDAVVAVSERSESLLFVGLGAVAFVTAFLAMTLVQKGAQTNRRLVLCGYRPSELLVAKLATLLCVLAVVGTYASAGLVLLFRPRHIAAMLVGFLSGGYVYGAYGLVVGALVRRELEGTLAIALLVNVDAGWLENPVYYADAQNKAILRWLPAYYPSQISAVSAFTDDSIQKALIGSLAYGTTFLLVALLFYWKRMRGSSSCALIPP
jgi:ABC-2 type transport system permease protein